MIEHAWSVICDKSFIDRDTNLVSMDAFEQIDIKVPGGEAASPHSFVIPCNVMIVSLWYRSGTPYAEGERAHARVQLLAPGGRELWADSLPLDLTEFPRYRTRIGIPGGLPYAGAGTYFCVV